MVDRCMDTKYQQVAEKNFDTNRQLNGYLDAKEAKVNMILLA
jgi:hypothetical protein